MKHIYSLFLHCLIVLLLFACILTPCFAEGLPTVEATEPGSVPSTEADVVLPTDPDETEPASPVEPLLPEDPDDPEVPTEPTQPTAPTQPIQPVTHTLYINGRNDGSFGPSKSLTRAEVAQIIWNLGDYPAGTARFSDVGTSVWYAKPINALAQAGVLRGYSDGTFRPKKAVTRTELVTILQRLVGETAETEVSFPDVSRSFWGYQAIALAQEKGWVNGYTDGTFRPSKAVKRSEAVAILNRYLGRIPDREVIDTDPNVRFFPDVRRGSWYYYDVMEAAVTHSAVCSVQEEHWSDAIPRVLNLADGFYVIGSKLYVVSDKAFVREAGTGVMNGIAYTCKGESGVCTVSVRVLTLANGNLALLKDGKPMGQPGEFADGFYLIGSDLYAAKNGYVLHSGRREKLGSVSFSCAGSGICNVDATVLSLVNEDLIFLKNGVAEILPGAYTDGFYIRAGQIYAAKGGMLIHKAQTDKLVGFSYTCTGSNGVCTVNTEVLRLVDGELAFLNNGKLQIAPGSFPAGFHIKGGQLYAAENGRLVHTAKTGKLGGISYTCTGSSGVCTVSADVLKLADGNLTFLKDGLLELVPGAFADGFYARSGQLYAAVKGSLVHTAQTSSLNGISYTCQGESGSCTAQTQILKLVNGELALLKNHKLEGMPGSYSNGFQVRNGLLYVVKNGSVLHKQESGTLNGSAYTCTGDSGICKANWVGLTLPGIDLVPFANKAAQKPGCSFTDVPQSLSAYSAIALQCALGTMTGSSGTAFSPDAALTYADALRAAVTVYETYFRAEPASASDPWYQSYVDRARLYEILTSNISNYSAAIPRSELAVYLCRALRGRELTQKNSIAMVPGLSANHPSYSSFLSLYQAGVLRGIDQADNAGPTQGITRGEFAQILNRLVLPEQRLTFTVTDKVVETIQYGTSGSGKYPLTAYRIGNGANVMVLTFAVHGWEDVWVQDGSALVYLADQTKEYLDNNYNLVRNGNWTVYILRCVNPDGLYDGTTCNGPGRCTTTYYNANGVLVKGSGKGIDINRCFPYNYVSRTDARNFNGTAPLQCAEARALATFVQQVKGSGKNICIDTHGWFSQIITSAGKGTTIYNAFLKQFPYNTYASLRGASGYFSSWAYSIGYDSCLFELPNSVTSFQSFLSQGCVGRFEAVIADLLQNYTSSGATRGPLSPDETDLDGN